MRDETHGPAGGPEQSSRSGNLAEATVSPLRAGTGDGPKDQPPAVRPCATPAPSHDRPTESRVPSPQGIYAAIDLGTNNCRLLVARPTARSFRVVDAFSRIVRLGEGLGATGRLCDGAMERALGALEICAAKMDLRGVTRARMVAT